MSCVSSRSEPYYQCSQVTQFMTADGQWVPWSLASNCSSTIDCQIRLNILLAHTLRLVKLLLHDVSQVLCAISISDMLSLGTAWANVPWKNSCALLGFGLHLHAICKHGKKSAALSYLDKLLTGAASRRGSTQSPWSMLLTEIRFLSVILPFSYLSRQSRTPVTMITRHTPSNFTVGSFCSIHALHPWVAEVL